MFLPFLPLKVVIIYHNMFGNDLKYYHIRIVIYICVSSSVAMCTENVLNIPTVQTIFNVLGKIMKTFKSKYQYTTLVRQH